MRVQVAAYVDQLLRVRLHAGQHGPEQAVPVRDGPRGRRGGSRGHEGQAYPQGAPAPDRSVGQEVLSTRDCTSMTGMSVVASTAFGSRSPPGPALLVQAACQPVTDSTGNPPA